MVTIQDQLKALQDRFGLTNAQLAAYLGVRVTTLHHWQQGTRQGGATLRRLLEVLGTIEALAPGVHEALMPLKKEK